METPTKTPLSTVTVGACEEAKPTMAAAVRVEANERRMVGAKWETVE